MKNTSPHVPYPEPGAAILLASPSEDDHISLRRILDGSNWQLVDAFSCEEARALLLEREVPVVICESRLPDGNWKSFQEETLSFSRPPRLIVSSRLADDYLWGEALNLGCYDVLPTPFESEEVLRVAFLAWHSWKREAERNAATGKSPKAAGRAGWHPMQSKAAGS
jgi:DNA-binding NtrC family response regulator